MRIKKKNSLASYIFYHNVMVVVCLSAYILFLIGLFTDILIQFDLRDKLMDTCHFYENDIRMVDGEVILSQPFPVYNIEGILSIISDEKGQTFYGKLPEKGFSKLAFKDETTRKVFVGKTNYYIHDDFVKIQDESTKKINKIYIRSIIECSQFNSIYIIIRRVKYLCATLILVGCVFAMYLVFKSMDKPLSMISEMANDISNSQDLSSRIEVDDNALDEIKSLANAHNSMLIRAGELVEVQKQFSSDVAHELKTPISVIIAECQFSSKYLTDDEDVEKAFNVIEEQARKTNQIINNLLELTRLEKNQVKMNFQYLDFSEIVHSACDLESLIDCKNIVIHKDIKECNANVDLNLMLMAIRNIVNNAIKYSEDHGEIYVRAYPDHGKILIQCVDHGCGMTEETKKHIFDRFYRADSSRSSEGLGLGMAITKKIIELHQGSIHLESEYGKGCSVSIEIPIG